MKTLIDFIYTVLIGVAVAVFVGLGIWTFYSGPKAPEFPTYPNTIGEPTEAQKQQFDKQTQDYNKQYDVFKDKEKPYSKKVSGIALAAGVVFFAGGLWLIRRNQTVGEGLSLGGVFTEIYSAIRGGIGDSKPLVFVSVTLILVMLVFLVMNRAGTFWPALPKRKS